MASSGDGVLDDYEWVKLPDMPTPRCFTVGAHHQNKLYVIGGCNKEGQPIQAAEVYDFDTKKWDRLPNLPIPRANCTGAIVRGNQIIVVGGVTTKQIPIDKVDCFDIDTQKWVEFPSLPLGVVGPYVRLVDDQLYCIGGTDKKGCNQSVMFDFDKRKWLNLPRKPTACYSCGGYLYDRKLIIVGGRGGEKNATPIQEVEAFCLDTRQWERLAAMSSIRVFYSIVGIEDEIYVMGGLIPGSGLTKVVERYSINEDMWCRIRDLNELRSDCAYGVVGKHVVVAGGLGADPSNKEKPPFPMKTGEATQYRGRRFKKIPQMFMQRCSLSSLHFNGKLAVMNGVGDGGPQPIVEILQVKETKKND